MMSERQLADMAFRGLDSNTAAQWPAVAKRIRQARRRRRLDSVEVAARIGITTSAYYDLETRDDECFAVLSLAEIARLAQALGVSPRKLLLGDDEGREPPTTFAEISRRLHERIAAADVGIEEIAQAIGWDIEALLTNPDALWDFNLVGLHDVCRAIDQDWVSALPNEHALPPARNLPTPLLHSEPE